MTAHVKPYPAMKESGVPWLGKVPEHWRTERAKWLFRRMNRPVRETDQVVTCFRDGTVTLRTNRRVGGFTESLKEIGYQGIRRGDLVIHAMDAFAGAVGVSDVDGKGTPVYSVCEPRPMVDAHYYAYAIREMARSQWIQALAKGIRERSTDFRFEGFGSQPVPLPPLPEQAAIVRFLDYADRRIRKYIRAKQTLIKLLEEQVAVRASATMQLPACRAKRLQNVAVECLRPIGREAGELYVPLGLYNRGRGIFHKPPTFGVDLGDSSFSWVEPGDLIVSGQFAWEGAVALASAAESRKIVSHRYHLLRGVEGQTTTPYLWALLRSDFGAMILDQHSRGAAGRNRPLNLRTLLKEMVPVPPFEAQLALDELVETIAPLRAQAVAAVANCREFRVRLIADVVTGKLDVRDAAARLPKDVDQAEPLDEIESEGEGGETGADDTSEVLEEAEA